MMNDSTYSFAASYFGSVLGGEATAWQNDTLFFSKSYIEGYVASLSKKDGAWIRDGSELDSALYYQLYGYCKVHDIELTP